MKKRFIEWDMPLAEISEQSAKEKNIRHGHPSTLHIWWARRPLAASRATAFAALLDLPEEQEKREEIKELIKKISPWDAVKNGNSKDVERAKKMILEQWGRPPKVLDPFAGGGSIPLETLRLGCETYASDYNPVAVFIEKATLEWPQKYGIEIPNPDQQPFEGAEKVNFLGTKKVNFLVYMVEKWANKILEEAKEEIGRFYPEEPDGSIPVGYIWARTIPCQNPSCGAEIPLIRQFWLAKKDNKKVAYKPVVDKENKKVDFIIQEGDEIDFDPGEGTVSRAKAMCPVCGQVTKNVSSLARKGMMGQRLIAVVLHKPGERGKRYRVATEVDQRIFEEAECYLEEKINNWPYLDSPLPDEPTPEGRGRGAERAFAIRNYGLNIWADLFNARQKLSLITFMDKIKANRENIKKDCKSFLSNKHGIDCQEAAKAVIGYLGLTLNKVAQFTTRNCTWKVSSEQVINLFGGRNAIQFTWDFYDSNPISGISTSWNNSVGIVLQGISVTEYESNLNLDHSSATSLPYPNNYFDAILTDPPYYDNVPYSYLSDFYYVWLKRSVGELFPEIFSTPTTPKSNEIVAYTHDSSWDEAKENFEAMLSDSFKEFQRVLKSGGVTVIVYAHKTTSGWETLLNSLVKSGLVVTASWPIHTEMKARLRAAASAALASSIYMVCRKTEREPVGYFNEIKPQIKSRIEEKLQQFWNENIVGGDLFISAIGPAMETFSKYERVEKYSGEIVTIAELLEYIRSVVTDWIVNELLKVVSSGALDKESYFYLIFRWTYLDNTVPYDDVRKLASASGINLEEMWNRGFVKKTGSNIKVLGPKERNSIDKTENMVDVMHKSALLWEKGKKDELNKLLSDTGYGQNPAFWQFCQAIAETLLNGNKEKQLLEGLLMSRDSYMHKEEKRQLSLEDY